MRAGRTLPKSFAWIAAAALLISSTAQAVVAALAPATDGPWTELCVSAGSAARTGKPGTNKPRSPECAWCSLHASSSVAPPSAPCWAPGVQAGATGCVLARAAAPRSPAAWARARSRAPPART
ncbi:MAG TPA: DUF2946 family protein [Burkholderiaceae bacterium]|nr:DUF2946 family protein [Burkholderiaceae bacterium]